MQQTTFCREEHTLKKLYYFPRASIESGILQQHHVIFYLFTEYAIHRTTVVSTIPLIGEDRLRQ